MRKFNVNVNGTNYEVAVEEINANEVASTTAAKPAAAPAAQKAPAAPAAPKAPVSVPVAANGAKVEAPMPGTILDVKVSVGQSVKAGDILFILEAMKMENEIVAPEAGKIASVNTTKGSSVESGTLLCVIG